MEGSVKCGGNALKKVRAHVTMPAPLKIVAANLMKSNGFNHAIGPYLESLIHRDYEQAQHRKHK